MIRKKKNAIEALRLCLCHMLTPGYLELALDKMKVWHVVDKWSLPHCNKEEFKPSVKHQLRALLQNGFIHVSIDPWVPESSNIRGQAYVGEKYKIKVTPRLGDKNKIVGFDYVSEGSFNLWLGAQALEEHSAKEMAGTVAHEMLHQMGHEHREGYKDDNFMTVFGDIVANEGKFETRSTSRDSDHDMALDVGCPVGLEKIKDRRINN